MIEEPAATGEPSEAWELRESRELLDTIITCAPVGFGLFDPAMRFVRVNEELADIGGCSADDLVGRRPQEVMPPPWAEALAGPFRRVLDTGEPVDDLEVAAPTAADPGRDHTWLATWYPVRHDGEIVAVGLFVTDISDRVRAERGLQLLFDVGEALDATLGVEERLARLAALVVPTLGDFCTIEMLEASGEARLVAGARLPEGAHAHPDRLIAVPLRARGRDLGTLTLRMGPSGRSYDDADRALALQLGRRAGLAVENATLYRERSEQARTLQQSLLPPSLPAITGVRLAARYHPAGEGNEVGGDFYDVFPIRDGAYGFAIGDVCGTGPEAAAVTGLARHALRLLAREGFDGPAVLERLNAAILDEGARSRFLTLLYGELWPQEDGSALLKVVCAGHPLPLRLRQDGSVEPAAEPQPLLGVIDDLELYEQEVTLDPGDVLLCVTDGVTERREGARMLGDDGLADVLSMCTGLTAGAVAGRILRAVERFAAEPASDDMAILAMRVPEPQNF